MSDYKVGDIHPELNQCAFIGQCSCGGNTWTSIFDDQDAPSRLAKSFDPVCKGHIVHDGKGTTVFTAQQWAERRNAKD